MNDTGVIDNFLSVFSTYIDSGFGLLGGEVGFLSSTLIVIDITIAALFWAWGTDEDVLQRLVKKTLYIGVFAFIIGNFQALATILLESFAGLGLKAAGSAMAIGDFMRPGMIASTGLDAAEPLLDATADLVGPVGLFTNFVQILILLIAWVIVVIAFFILAVQVFVTILEFKLVTLAGFVLLPSWPSASSAISSPRASSCSCSRSSPASARPSSSASWTRGSGPNPTSAR